MSSEHNKYVIDGQSEADKEKQKNNRSNIRSSKMLRTYDKAFN